MGTLKFAMCNINSLYDITESILTNRSEFIYDLKNLMHKWFLFVKKYNVIKKEEKRSNL